MIIGKSVLQVKESIWVGGCGITKKPKLIIESFQREDSMDGGLPFFFLVAYYASTPIA
jgi:hypothetical protein